MRAALGSCWSCEAEHRPLPVCSPTQTAGGPGPAVPEPVACRPVATSPLRALDSDDSALLVWAEDWPGPEPVTLPRVTPHG